jgi:dihydrofolate reductase
MGLMTMGSSVLVHTLAQHDLVDEYSLLVYPVVLGSGKKLFPDGLRLNLRLIRKGTPHRSRPVVRLPRAGRSRPAGPPTISTCRR